MYNPEKLKKKRSLKFTHIRNESLKRKHDCWEHRETVGNTGKLQGKQGNSTEHKETIGNTGKPY